MIIVSILIAAALDLAFGDPPRLPHPVVLMGRAIQVLERVLRRVFPGTPDGLRTAGRVLVVVMCAGSFLITWGVIGLAGLISPILSFVVETFLCYQCLAACELRRQSMRVARVLREEGLPAARKAVGMIVGRETATLDAAGVLRAAVETVAENASDGVVAPLLYLMVGGAPLGMLYKAANTMDSMVGYKNARYRDFGRAAAHLDDVLNWLPSRMTALAMVAVAAPLGMDAAGAWRIWRRDRRRHASPNAAQPEAAVAGALGLRLAGPAVYFGRVVNKPTIGDARRPIQIADVARANRLMLAASALCLAALALARLLLTMPVIRVGA